MANHPAFEFFETICVELAVDPSEVLSEDTFDSELLEDLKEAFNETATPVAFDRAVDFLAAHFAERGSRLPFQFARKTREFRATDTDYVEFVAFASNHRGAGGEDSKEFEKRTMRRLARRLTGHLHSVGSPRSKKFQKKADFVKHLRLIGFDEKCLEARDQDGGLDIVWLPPLGAIPIRPMWPLQCKNGYFDEAKANESSGRAMRTLGRHPNLRDPSFVFVVFNDWIDMSFNSRARKWIFVPLGLSDLAEVPDGKQITEIWL